MRSGVGATKSPKRKPEGGLAIKREGIPPKTQFKKEDFAFNNNCGAGPIDAPSQNMRVPTA
jgi:hypothetical protein